MKIRKVLFCLSAISLTLYSVWEIIRQTPLIGPWYKEYIWGNPLRVELFWLPYTWLFLGGVLLALIAVLIRTDEKLSVTKAHRYGTYALSVLSLFVTGWAVIHAVQVYGMGFLYAPTWLRIFMDLACCAWLWMIVIHPRNHQLPKSLRSFIAMGIGLISLLLVLQLASGVAYLTTGHILMFRTHAFGNWLRYLVPMVLLCMYSIELLDKWPSPKLIKLHKQRNSHCTYRSMTEKLYPTIRIVSFVFMGLTLIAFYCLMMWMNCFAFHNYVRIAGEALAIFMGVLWLLLTFMAFFQLPNPRGYKIYNWISLGLNFCLPVGLFISFYFEGNTKIEDIGAVFGLTGLFSLISYLLFTFIRIVLYTMPRPQGIDKLKGIQLKEGAIIPDGQSEDPENIEEYISEERRICPYCGSRKDKFELLCYYNNEGIIWSDFRHVLPQVAVPSLIQKCPHCGKYYISKGSHVLIKDTADFEFIDPVSWDYFKQSYEEFSQLDKDNVVDYNHRLRMMCAYNDEFNRSQNPPVPTEQDIMLFKDNLLHLMEYFSDPIDKAELYREMGLFDECFKQLEMVDDEGNESKKGYKETIFDFAKNGSVRPFGWKED